MPFKQDTIYATQQDRVADFVFDHRIAAVFQDMIRRSVPGYATLLSMLPVFAREYVRENSLCYDLGCSLGASALALRSGIQHKGCRIVAVDSAPAMLDRFRSILELDSSTVPVEMVCDDVRNVEISNASVVAMNFTMQFIPLPDRLALLTKVCDGLLPGGVLLLSEKIRFADKWQQETHTALHHAFKKANGYSELEISQKRSALEKVLLPETLASHQERLGAAGFASCDVWFQCFNFASIMAVK